MSRQSRSVIRGHLHEGTIGHLRRVCARLQLRANDCSRSQLIEHVLDDARQDEGAYRLLSNFNFDSLVEILKMRDGRVRTTRNGHKMRHGEDSDAMGTGKQSRQRQTCSNCCCNMHATQCIC